MKILHKLSGRANTVLIDWAILSSMNILLSGQVMLSDLLVLTLPPGARSCAWVANVYGHSGMMFCMECSISWPATEACVIAG